ncbi:MAG: hypothetical protein GX230_04795 [Lentisphaerae bacterium]|jgi:hypothetical protein|nr:hypothetical protein [Lentisphaerota bacterium]
MAIGRTERVIRVLLALALLPLCAATTLVNLDMLTAAAAAADTFLTPLLALIGGAAIWTLVYIFLPHPVRTYIIGHELTHALWGLLFGARFSNIKVGDSGGSVRLTKTNTLITLAPYFFPFYTMILTAIWFVAGLFLNLTPYTLIFLFLVGLTWSFHITFTINSLLIHQPDIVECGRLFSYVLIYILNVIGISLWIICATPVADTALVDSMITRTTSAYATTGHSLRKVTISLFHTISNLYHNYGTHN